MRIEVSPPAPPEVAAVIAAAVQASLAAAPPPAAPPPSAWYLRGLLEGVTPPSPAPAAPLWRSAP